MANDQFGYYNLFEQFNNIPVDEIVYHRMHESSNIIKRTDSGELFYDTVYSPRLSTATIKTHADYIAFNNSITGLKVANDKKEMNDNCVLFFFKEMFGCRW